MPYGNDTAKLAPATFQLTTASGYSGISIDKLRDLISKNKIRSVKPFGRHLVLKTDLDRYLGIDQLKPTP